MKTSSPNREPKLFVFPGGIEPEILAVGSGQIPYARTDDFGELVLRCRDWFLKLTDCDAGQWIPLTSSGTAAMEATAANLSNQRARFLVVDGGTFGRRWLEILSLYPHEKIDVHRVPFGADLDYSALESTIASGRYDALFMQHHETSSGALFDIKKVGDACRKAGTLFVVDSIGSFLADDFSMKEFLVDVAVISSHKGLCLPPGLSFVVLGEEALNRPFFRRSAYFDFSANLDSLSRGQPLFTPAVQIFLQLHERLKGLADRGVAEWLGPVKQKAEGFREVLSAAGRSFVPERASNCLTSFRVRGEGKRLTMELATQGWYIMPSAETDQVRVSHLGTSSVDDHLQLYEKICETELHIERGTDG